MRAGPGTLPSATTTTGWGLVGLRELLAVQTYRADTAVQTLRADLGQHLDVKRRPSTTRRLQHSTANFGGGLSRRPQPAIVTGVFRSVRRRPAIRSHVENRDDTDRAAYPLSSFRLAWIHR